MELIICNDKNRAPTAEDFAAEIISDKELVMLHRERNRWCTFSASPTQNVVLADPQRQARIHK
jgi:hypothetical protein